MYGSWTKQYIIPCCSKEKILGITTDIQLKCNLFVPNASFLYHLKTSENVTVFCFQGVETMCSRKEWVNKHFVHLCNKESFNIVSFLE